MFVCRQDEELLESLGTPVDQAGLADFIGKLKAHVSVFPVNHSTGISMRRNVEQKCAISLQILFQCDVEQCKAA